MIRAVCPAAGQGGTLKADGELALVTPIPAEFAEALDLEVTGIKQLDGTIDPAKDSAAGGGSGGLNDRSSGTGQRIKRDRYVRAQH